MGRVRSASFAPKKGFRQRQRHAKSFIVIVQHICVRFIESVKHVKFRREALIRHVGNVLSIFITNAEIASMACYEAPVDTLNFFEAAKN
ncbi:uncharacterized protein PHALS_03032 [Plasmopara halstedii]|uniref:Uncharacterized protein n=1 Tax=Plasmopara halstedii TaxID=4781 RepID=A0A0P1A8B3_PLAHL|nr:uncharacterized protein PHALS_03032 [Plasmopara halstedii]CEG36484.1 hypothetical protein PHALS_03032 [Plasmopara halstedii]|eukprot:XP_024572853.1 hypothetical protein PHALS_03032 [Plasmopara halstedii]